MPPRVHAPACARTVRVAYSTTAQESATRPHACLVYTAVPHRYAYLVPNINAPGDYNGVVARVDLDASFDTSAVETLDLQAPPL